MSKKITIIFFVVIAILLVVIIAWRLVSIPVKTGTQIANPASVNCEEQGGRLDIRTDEAGGQIGYCIFEDGTECEEWAFLRGECFTNKENFRNLNIKEGDQITSPLKITGEARGTWFFEASFPVNLVNWDGLIIGEGLAQTKSDWMTTDFVPFEAEIKFTKPLELGTGRSDYAKRGAIIFKKDNPSGLPAGEAAYEMPISF